MRQRRRNRPARRRHHDDVRVDGDDRARSVGGWLTHQLISTVLPAIVIFEDPLMSTTAASILKVPLVVSVMSPSFLSVIFDPPAAISARPPPDPSTVTRMSPA